MAQTLIFDHNNELVDCAINKWRDIANQAIAEKGQFTVAISGGKTPKPLLQKLAQQKDLPWDKTHIFLVDERMVPLTHPDSNYHLIQQHLTIPADNFHHIHTETTTVEKAAQRYEVELTMFFQLQENHIPQFDLIILGLGEDGHTASLFPHDSNVSDTKYLAMAVENKVIKHKRVTITIPVVNNANNIIFLVTGANKAKIAANIIHKQDLQLPAAQVNPQHGNLFFLLDKAAAKLLQTETYHLNFYVPKSHLQQVKTALFATGAGKLGNYDCCCWQTKGKGQFRPQAGSKPFSGAQGKIKQVTEYKVEMICEAKHIKAAIKALKTNHPYEEPAYNIIKLERF